MEWMHFVVILIILGAVWCEDTKNEDFLEEDDRESRQYNQEGWQVAESFTKETSDWIPSGETPLDQQLKRRRLRKRKRKPQPIDYFSDYEEPYIKRFHPERVDQKRDPWEELEKEITMIPAMRRRITPVYHAPQDATTNPAEPGQHSSNKNKSLTSSMMVEDGKISRKTYARVSLDGLKSLLKKSKGNISLSEILQQRNLSLSELLKGGEHAISALTEKPLAMTTPSKIIYATDKEPNSKYKRLPPSIALMKTTDRSFVQNDPSSETLTEQETFEAQMKRLTLLQSKENKLFPSFNRMDSTTVPTTERRIVVSSTPEYSTSPQLSHEYSTTSTSTTSISTPTTSTTPKIMTTASQTPKGIKINKLYINNEEKNNLPITNAKLKLSTKKISVNGFAEPIKISINEILGFGSDELKENDDDAPMKVSIDLEEFVKENEEIFQTPLPEENTTAENQTHITARKEIMEVMEDPVSRAKLSRILEDRNMTLNELVEQRERGSSQHHLADIFHNSTREPEPKEETVVSQIMSDSFQNFPELTRQSKSRNFEEEMNEKILPTAEQPELITSIPEDLPRTEGPKVKKDLNVSNVNPFPWKELYPDLFGDSAENDVVARENGIEKRIDNNLSLSSEQQLELDEYDLYLHIPPGVKSALFVSLAIIGLSLVVFVTLLLVFRWLQKKKRAVKYANGLSSKIGSAIIVKGQPSNDLRSFVNEKSKKKNNFSKSHTQSMSDIIWESGSNRKLSF